MKLNNNIRIRLTPCGAEYQKVQLYIDGDHHVFWPYAGAGGQFSSFLHAVYNLYDDKTAKHGYHAIMVCGWNKDGWVCQNSWGSKWNKDGTFVFPFSENFREAWSFVDAANDDVIRPKNNKLFNYIYKFINMIINFIKKRI